MLRGNDREETVKGIGLFQKGESGAIASILIVFCFPFCLLFLCDSSIEVLLLTSLESCLASFGLLAVLAVERRLEYCCVETW